MPTRFDAYVRGNLDRRSFLDTAQKLATAGVAVAAVLAVFTPDFAAGQVVPPTSAAPAAPTVRLRGTIQSVAPNSITMKTRDGEVVQLALAPNLVVSEVYAIELADIKAGSFVGVGGMPQADGSQRAIAVTVFPESARGTGEGHRPFDFVPQSTMTNATVADVASAPEGRKLQLKYKDGEKTIVVPPGTPIVTFKPSDRALLVPGASVAVTAQGNAAGAVALRVSAGRNGFTVPY